MKGDRVRVNLARWLKAYHVDPFAVVVLDGLEALGALPWVAWIVVTPDGPTGAIYKTRATAAAGRKRLLSASFRWVWSDLDRDHARESIPPMYTHESEVWIEPVLVIRLARGLDSGDG